MKPDIHHFHANPPHHGAKYYLATVGAILVVATVYMITALTCQTV